MQLSSSPTAPESVPEKRYSSTCSHVDSAYASTGADQSSGPASLFDETDSTEDAILEAMAGSPDWHVVSVSRQEAEQTTSVAPVKEGVKGILVLSMLASRKQTCALVKALSDSGMNLPIVVCLAEEFDPGHAGPVTEAQTAFHAAGACDLITMPIGGCEALKLALSISLKRYDWHVKEQAALNEQIKYLQKKIFSRSENEMFWSCAHEVFKDFPKLEPGTKMDFSCRAPYIGPLELGQKLGEGAYGKVFKGKNKETGEMEAVKLLSKHRIQRLSHVRKVWNEATVLRNVKHRSIARMLGVLHTPRYIVLRIELVGQRNLNDFQADNGGRLDSEVLWGVGGQIADALAYLHAGGIAHRDIKQENVVLRDAEPEDAFCPTVKLVDFGLAAQVSEGSSLGQCGTMPFIAPEILQAEEPGLLWNSDGDPDPCAADVWAHGVMMLEMACGMGSVNRMLGWPVEVEPTASKGVELAAFFCQGAGAIEAGFAQAGMAAEQPPVGSDQLVTLLSMELTVDPFQRWTSQQVADSIAGISLWIEAAAPLRRRLFAQVAQHGSSHASS